MAKPKHRVPGKVQSIRLSFRSIAGCYDVLDKLNLRRPDDGMGTVIRIAVDSMLKTLRSAGHISDYANEVDAWDHIKSINLPDRWVRQQIMLEKSFEMEAGDDTADYMDAVQSEETLMQELDSQLAVSADTLRHENLAEATAQAGVRTSADDSGPVAPTIDDSIPPWEGTNLPETVEVDDFFLTPKGGNSPVAELVRQANDEKDEIMARAVQAAMGSIPKSRWADRLCSDMAKKYYERFKRWKERQDGLP